MSEEDIANDEDDRKYLLAMKDSILKKIENSSPYDNYWYVLDTDYDNFLIQYACQEQVELVNQFGQTEDQIEMLKLEDSSKSFDEDFTTSKTKHQFMATI